MLSKFEKERNAVSMVDWSARAGNSSRILEAEKTNTVNEVISDGRGVAGTTWIRSILVTFGSADDVVSSTSEA